MNRYDVIIIGAGPAGCATALFLQSRGYRVVVLDQARFPRDKVCGEFISPAADPILEELGLMDAIEQTQPVRLQGVAISAYGNETLCIDYPPHPQDARPMTSLSLPRFVFDHLLVKRLRHAGIELREAHKVDDLIFENGSVVGVKVRDGDQAPLTLKARMVVDAGGRNSIALRRLNLKQGSARQRKIALAAHWTGAQLSHNYCTMHISPPGYTGMARVGDDLLNVVLVVDSKLVKGRERASFYTEAVLSNPLRRKYLAGAVLKGPVRAVDSLSYRVKPVPCGGLLLVGDATGFIDPFTGEGIYLSLRSAQLAGEVLDRAFRSKQFSREVVQRYEVLRLREFHKKFTLSRILQRLIYNPWLCRRVVTALAANPDLAQQLVGVLGDYMPAEHVVSFRFLVKTILAGLRPQSGKRGCKNFDFRRLLKSADPE